MFCRAGYGSVESSPMSYFAEFSDVGPTSRKSEKGSNASVPIEVDTAPGSLERWLNHMRIAGLPE